MYYRTFLVMLLSIFTKVSISQSGNLVYVFDAETKIPLQDVSIHVGDKHLFTDENGYSNLINMKLTLDSIFFEKSGYQKKGFSFKNIQFPAAVY